MVENNVSKLPVKMAHKLGKFDFLQPYGLVLCGKNPNYSRKGGYILHDKNNVCNKEQKLRR